MLKFQRLLIGLFILTVPILYPLREVASARDFQQTIYQYGVMMLAVFFVRNIWMAIFFCWTVFLYYLNQGAVGRETVLNVFLGIILYGLAKQIYSKFRFEKEAKWIAWVGLISLVFMILQAFRIDPLHVQMDIEGVRYPFESFNDSVGIFALKAHNGIFLSLLVPIMALAHPLLGILMLLPIKLCQSSGAILAACVSLLFFLWFTGKKRWFIGTLAVLILSGGYFFFKDYKSDPKMYGSRFNIWHLTFRQSLLRPIGYGPDSFRGLTPHKNFLIMGDQDFHSAIGIPTDEPGAFRFMYYDPDNGKMNKVNDPKSGYILKSPNMWDHPHNEYLNLLFCWGFPGFIIFMLFMRDEITRFIRAQKTKEVVLLASLIVVYFAASTTQFPLSVARLGYIFPILLGAFCVVTEGEYAAS